MSKFVYLAATEGKIEVSVEQEFVGSSNTPVGLAQIFQKNQINGSDDIYFSSTIDFAEEEGFESREQAIELIQEAVNLMEAA